MQVDLTVSAQEVDERLGLVTGVSSQTASLSTPISPAAAYTAPARAEDRERNQPILSKY